LVKDKRIQTKKIDFSFEVFNADGTKNGEVTKVAPLEVEINGHKETLKAAVTDLDGTDMFLGHNWLVKHNPEVNWKNGTIKFTRCLGNCTMTHKDIYSSTSDGQKKQQQTKQNRTTAKLERNRIKQIQKIYQSIFDLSPIYSTRRNSKYYQSEENGITKST